LNFVDFSHSKPGGPGSESDLQRRSACHKHLRRPTLR